MTPNEERARRALEVARAGHQPNATDAERVRARLRARVLAEPLLIAPTPAPPLVGANWLGKLVAALAVAAGAGFAAGFVVAQSLVPAAVAPFEGPASSSAPGSLPHPVGNVASVASVVAAPPAAASEPAPTTQVEPTSAPPSGGAQSDALSAQAPLAPARAAQRSATRAQPTPPSSLKVELDGLRRAQELLYQGQPAWALARLDELDRADASSALLEERAATRAIAECRLGGDARGHAEDFARRYPGSAHLGQVRASCREAAPLQTEKPGSRHQ